MKKSALTQATFDHNEVATVLASIAQLDPTRCRLEVVQNQDKSLAFIITQEVNYAEVS